MYDYHHNTLPKCFEQYIPKKTLATDTESTRQYNQLCTDKLRTHFLLNSMHHFIQPWHNLDYKIQNFKPRHKFKCFSIESACDAPTPLVQYHRKSSMSKMFSALTLALEYGYQVMSQLLNFLCYLCVSGHYNRTTVITTGAGTCCLYIHTTKAPTYVYLDEH